MCELIHRMSSSKSIINAWLLCIPLFWTSKEASRYHEDSCNNVRDVNQWVSSLTWHHSDVIMGMMASQITSVSNVYSTVCSGIDQRKYQSSATLAFVRGIHRGPVNSPRNRPVTRKTSPFDDVIMINFNASMDEYVPSIINCVMKLFHPWWAWYYLSRRGLNLIHASNIIMGQIQRDKCPISQEIMNSNFVINYFSLVHDK